MKTINSFGLVWAVLMVLATLLPWIGVKESASIAGFGGDLSTSATGLSFWGGILGLIISIVGGILMYKKISFTIFAGIINLIIAVGYIFGWFLPVNFHTMVNAANYGNFSVSIVVQFGLYAFVGFSVLFIIAAKQYFTNVAEINKDLSEIGKNIQMSAEQTTQQLKQSTQTIIQKGTQTCPNCNTQYPLTSKFCSNCGTPAIKEKICEYCGAKVAPNVNFCPNCGKTIVSSTKPTLKKEIMDDDL